MYPVMIRFSYSARGTRQNLDIFSLSNDRRLVSVKNLFVLTISIVPENHPGYPDSEKYIRGEYDFLNGTEDFKWWKRFSSGAF
jgi:hypothetical protein